ncbi:MULTISPECIES: ATP-binding cassette domain-containing protein [unclassified Acinetobacter]|uniref:ATP-binding cassette domain-containing protein n=1 Tax=unclassified Acinetobacter TaxID=196816 RepID=UPI002446FF55|nr:MULTISPECIES: ATP-binding cassette domain-containing protein [unclassified Acinetobacter]MDH0030363.1 ATP-binding cassette domain-containing protein [Acinetobacter sp. GD04021]MDH0885931.1 ATP-binding cassette domain-containing protein [Acinetobacter sp. GD03873]MDH1082551.1 ATP-binding cassette domain-containing protein [Acinetobacter sp. GD03983]MDH2189057.1 ATP-binding cassette domain-containing protein [Acinetobacter sp. GD03645]MDH2202245.1 ATP-binding cassette domain-containing protei
MTQQACIVSNLSLELPQHKLFNHLSFQLPLQQFSGLIGRNGQGKSLLMSILHLQQDSQLPYSGQILWQCPHQYLAQLQRIEADIIAQALEIEDLYLCFERIQQGIASFRDYDQVENLWHLPTEWQQLLESAKLPSDLNTPIQYLSEGQKTKLALCRLFLRKDHYLLLDEPSNHLDAQGRKWLIKQIAQHPTGGLIISHDRELLTHAQGIFALNQFGLHYYGGNYALYYQQHQSQVDALSQAVQQEKRELKQLKEQQHLSQMKAQKRKKTGEKLKASGSQASILLDAKKEQSEQSLSHLRKQQVKQLADTKNELQQKQVQLEYFKSQSFEFTQLTGKSGEILRCQQLQLAYTKTKPIDLAITAGEKLHLRGKNGVGKSTLFKTIQGFIEPLSGEIHCKVNTAYLDQNLSLVEENLSAVDYLLSIDPELSEQQCRTLLGSLQIRRDKALMSLSSLSGGERLKVALLAVKLQSLELLLLDEPENHLDIESRELLAHAIHSFNGAVILVSHDDQFVEECGIKQFYILA